MLRRTIHDDYGTNVYYAGTSRGILGNGVTPRPCLIIIVSLLHKATKFRQCTFTAFLRYREFNRENRRDKRIRRSNKLATLLKYCNGLGVAKTYVLESCDDAVLFMKAIWFRNEFTFFAVRSIHAAYSKIQKGKKRKKMK